MGTWRERERKTLSVCLCRKREVCVCFFIYIDVGHEAPPCYGLRPNGSEQTLPSSRYTSTLTADAVGMHLCRCDRT